MALHFPFLFYFTFHFLSFSHAFTWYKTSIKNIWIFKEINASWDSTEIQIHLCAKCDSVLSFLCNYGMVIQSWFAVYSPKYIFFCLWLIYETQLHSVKNLRWLMKTYFLCYFKNENVSDLELNTELMSSLLEFWMKAVNFLVKFRKF